MANEVTRLGVDYQLGRRKGAKAKASSPRMRAAWRRCSKIRKARGRMRIAYTPVFRSGTLPGALYGAECLPLRPKQVARLCREGLLAEGRAFAGGPQEVLRLVGRVQGDAEFRTIAAPLLRWSREWWLSTLPSDYRPMDVLTPKELVQAHRLQEGVELIGAYVQWTKYPISAIRRSLDQLGWGWPSPGVFINRGAGRWSWLTARRRC